MAREKWYQGGLRFECTQCGNCCSGPPGYVWVTREDIARIAKSLGGEDERLDRKYLRRVGLRFSLTEKQDGDCIFLKREGGKSYCGIYKDRPVQCRTWPFWSQNLRSAEAWRRTSETCPGMNNGKQFDFVAIEELRLKRR